MKVTVRSLQGFVQPVATRMPFRYGSARLVRCPHFYLHAVIEDEQGRTAEGIAADNLPPKWFDKDPAKSYPQELTDQLQVIRWACQAALAAGRAAPFRIWHETYTATQNASRAAGLPALLGGFGPSLVERAVNDAVGRLLGLPFHALLRSGALEIDLAALDSSVPPVRVEQLLPAAPLQEIAARHAVGLSDPIRRQDIPEGEVIHDGLPQSLDDVVDFYGVRYFKIKISNQFEQDLAQLTAIAEVLDRHIPGEAYHCTLDGNEQYGTVEEILPLLGALEQQPNLQRLARSIVFLEQPLARSAALEPDRCLGIAAISQRFPVIIDESDAELGSFPAALALGYRGVSHKNCKNTFKSLLNLARAHQQRETTGQAPILSAEDLTNIGVIALPQDLAALATLGIPHAERNGHHYFRGLAHLTPEEQAAALAADPDLYCQDVPEAPTAEAGAADPANRQQSSPVRVRIERGMVNCTTIHRTPGLGAAVWPVLQRLTSMEDLDPADYAM